MSTLNSFGGIPISSYNKLLGKNISSYNKIMGYDVNPYYFEYINKNTISYNAQNFVGFYLDPTGTEMITTGVYGDYLYYSTLSTPFDITSFSSFSIRLMPSSYNDAMHDIYIANSGNLAFIFNGDVGATLETVTLHTLSSPYNYSTINQTVSSVLNITSYDPSNPKSIKVSDDGTKMYLSCTSFSDPTGINGEAYFFTMSTPYDPSTATLDGYVLIPPVYNNGSSNFHTLSEITSDGKYHFVFHTETGLNNYIVEFSQFTTPWDYTTETSRVVIGNINNLQHYFTGVFINPEGNRFGIYIVDSTYADYNKNFIKYMY